MRLRFLFIFVVGVCGGELAAQTTTIAFGSCLRQWNPQPVWSAVLAEKPDAFIFLGDNVYTDTGPLRHAPEPERIARAYAELAEDPGFDALRATVPIHATWDDHDYGQNDGGREYPWKDASKRLFLDFFAAPEGAIERSRPGIFTVRHLDQDDRRIQLILLDTRYFRSPLKVGPPTPDCPRRNLLPNTETGATILGDAQWAWLEKTLRDPADLRIIISSIQVIPDQHCFEKWANFPAERERLFRLIRDSGAQNVVILSGDRHLGEISKLPAEVVGYPLFEVTASGLNSAGAGKGEQNRYRVTEDSVREDHFGVLRIAWLRPEPSLRFSLKGADGKELGALTVPLDMLRRR
jgi:alkaline phosphatase D